MTKTKWYNFEGTVNYVKARADKPDEYLGRVAWTVDFYPKDAATAKAIKATGIQLKLKDDKEGKKHFRFRRDVERKFGTEIVKFSPPIIYDKDGTPIIQYVDSKDKTKVVRSYNPNETTIVADGNDIIIGNGSKVLLNVCVFNTQKGPGNRFESLKILDLIEYVKPEASEDLESDSAEDNTEIDW
jgi:hypothetical protein